MISNEPFDDEDYYNEDAEHTDGDQLIKVTLVI